MRVTILGCGDAFGSGGRFQAATLIEAGGAACLLDCGASTMSAINTYGVDPDRIDLIALTHLHGDHFGGVPFFLLDAQWLRARRRPLVIAGPPGTGERLRSANEVLFNGSANRSDWGFSWRVEEIEPGASHSLCGFDIRTVEVVHPCGAPPTAVRIEADGKAFVHSGDTEWTDALPAIARGTDLFFLECFAYRPTPTHLDYTTILARRDAFDAAAIVLTHLGPEMLKRLDAVDRALFDVAEDGRVFEL
ncbi:MBL fold metallo-hydrolase [Labrys wisconsinensis]|uniref:Ribonuclease BN (tRNA processing enzyme) n=1 Tax=Labrys wisconsinensis TaxID=425677 RepID=A0ABU0J9S1_9HYPH|nr:MBL fold metallo-hydrolase [Labrys wisconsinensis]MDQ0471020.1 ribonuclease BN (tRNA processing enzyme) [Labrys wisconsinensis]